MALQTEIVKRHQKEQQKPPAIEIVFQNKLGNSLSGVHFCILCDYGKLLGNMPQVFTKD